MLSWIEPKDGISLVALLISFSSAYISWEAYLASRAPAHLEARFGQSVSLGYMEFEDATIIGTIAMTNTGGRSGVIERILVVVQPNLPATSSGSEERGDRYALLPREEIAIDTTLNEWSTIGPPLPVTISGNTTLVHHYRFRDKAHGALRWVEQRYRLTLLAKIPGEKMYKLLDEAVIDIGDVVQLSPVHDAYRVIPVRVLPLDPDGLVTESGKISEGHVLEALFTRGAREASAAH